MERRGFLMANEKVQFNNFNEYFHDFHPHLMFYSWNGCGKTTLAGMDVINRNADKFDLLVVDTLTGLQSMAIREVKGKKAEMNQRKWGQVGSRVIECISETKSFPKDVIYLAQEKRKNRDEEEGTVQVIGPSLTPSVREYLSSSVDWVGRLYIENGKHKINFVLSDWIEAKDRGEIFPKTLVIPREGAYKGIRNRIVTSIHE